MWHRFTQPLRDAIDRALAEAHRDGRAAATAEDFTRALAARSCVEPSPRAAAITPDMIQLFERAYQRALERGDGSVGVEHLIDAPSAKRSWSLLQSIARAYKVYAQLSVVHPKFSTDPYPLYRRLRRRGPIYRD